MERFGRFLVKWWPAAMPSLVVCLVAYVWLVGWVVVHAPELIFHPDPARVAPEAAGLAGFETVEIASEDEVRLVAWWHPPATGGGIVLFLHGDAASLAGSAARLADLAAAGFGVLAIDWRGYGGSTGKPSERGFRADARAAYDWAEAAAPGSKIAVFGESLGTGVAVELATERKVAGVLLHSPYAAVVRNFELKGPPLIPYRLAVTDRFDTEAAIGQVEAPVMIIQGTEDAAIPIAETRRLFAAAHEPKSIVEIVGAGHLGAWQGDARAQALAALEAWTKKD